MHQKQEEGDDEKYLGMITAICLWSHYNKLIFIPNLWCPSLKKANKQKKNNKIECIVQMIDLAHLARIITRAQAVGRGQGA